MLKVSSLGNLFRKWLYFSRMPWSQILVVGTIIWIQSHQFSSAVVRIHQKMEFALLMHGTHISNCRLQVSWDSWFKHNSWIQTVFAFLPLLWYNINQDCAEILYISNLHPTSRPSFIPSMMNANQICNTTSVEEWLKRSKPSSRGASFKIECHLIFRYLGCKWTVALSFIAYMPFIAAQFYPRFYTLIPAGLAVGLGGGPLWCAKCTYLSVIAEAFSILTDGKIKTEVLVVRFFGLFFVFYQMAQVWGNLVSSAGKFWWRMVFKNGWW